MALEHDLSVLEKMTYMFLLSLAVAYLSSVVTLRMAPAAMGKSLSSTVLPVRISGPFYKYIDKLLDQIDGRKHQEHDQLTVSRAIATGRPAWVRSASRELSITDWWYWQDRLVASACWIDGPSTNLVGAVREVHANNIETS